MARSTSFALVLLMALIVLTLFVNVLRSTTSSTPRDSEDGEVRAAVESALRHLRDSDRQQAGGAGKGGQRSQGGAAPLVNGPRVSDPIGVPARPPSVSQPRSSNGLSKAEQERLDDLPPPLKETYFKRLFGVETWEKNQHNVLQLHNVPTDEWLKNATAVVNRCDLDEPFPYDSEEITLVSVLLDLGRGGKSSGTFQRSMQEYYNRFNKIINRGFKMVIFTSEEIEKDLNLDYSRIKVVPFTKAELKKYFPYTERVRALIRSKQYQKQAEHVGYLKTAPQNKLDGYLELVMSKLMLLRDAAVSNPWKTKYHMFVDSGHLCATKISPTNIGTFTSRMDKGMMVTYWPYGTQSEVHGMTDKAFHMYMGTAKDPLMIVRGGVFGGTLPYIKCATRGYLHALAVTLGDGYVGTEENILAMAYQHFPHLFEGFDNDSLGNHGDNCALFIQNERDGK